MKSSLRHTLWIWSLFLSIITAAIAPTTSFAEVVLAPYVEAELISEVTAAQVGRPLALGVRMKTDEGWHVYWKYAGDSGSAPKFKWKLNGATIEPPVDWPVPERIAVGPLMNYGYGGETLFIVTIPADKIDSSGELQVFLDAEWLVCKEECIPGNGELSLRLPASGSVSQTAESQRSKWHPLFESTRAKLPVLRTDIPVSSHFDNNSYVISFTPPFSPRDGFHVDFFPDVGDIIENAAPQKLTFDGKEHHLLIERNAIEEPLSPRLSGILVSNQGWSVDGTSPALAVDLVVAGVPSPAPVPLAVGTAPSTAGSIPAPISSEESLTLWTALLGAFLGGLILNVMPCVFPVLSIKILSFATEAGHSPRAARTHGLLFALGVVGSFWVLAGTLFLLRAAGEGLGWGFQLQSPSFVLGLLFVVFAIALNLLGVFEVGASLQRAVGTIQTGEGALGAIGSGALAVVLATPCTAPFMGSALAFALTVSALEGFVIFTALGVGMALPYVLLCSVPQLIRVLPRPGAWMETFKHLMAFPLFATAIWLLWVLGIQAGQEAIIAALIGLLSAGLGLWGLGVWSSPARKRSTRIFGRAFALTLISIGAYGAWTSIDSAGASVPQTSNPGVSVDKYGIAWETYSDERLAELLKSSQPVYIDFTAAWCITCQVNKRLVLSSEEVRNEFKRHNVALLKADWTNKDEKITAALARYGRQGVPLNVLYSGVPGSAPHLFPSILTSSMVLEELNKLK
jgi:thiol:disulfide interchange protein/DsbC/DsbD-like thiol-disulfide interchange protein